MNIVSYNVNGIRAAIIKGWIDWVGTHDFDVICLQETKAMEEQVDINDLLAKGYVGNWYSAQKKGYSGVATFSKTKPDAVFYGCGHPLFDAEGRVIRTDFGDLTVLNCYFPSGTSGGERQEVKMEFLSYFFDWAHELLKERPNVIIVGDYNIAHQEIDIHDPKGNKKSSGFLPEERAWMTKWFDAGFKDAFRTLYCDTVQYSWWTYRAGARANNKGWRIDYVSVSNNLAEKLLQAHHYNDAHHSDHCPIWVEIDW